ncbi:MAG: serine/threonine protein kinase [Planctomycetota bacterium]
MASEEQAHARGQKESAADLSNLQLGEFLLLRRLGSGGMAEVYLAEQLSLNRHVAVKILKNDATAAAGGSAVLLKRFEQEAKAAGGLSHPNIVQIITTGREGDLSYIVQEYVAGLNLSQWIRKHGAPDFQVGLQWMQQMASALGTASDAGIVHRDVKPENIMITRTNQAKVTDFGLAQLNQSATPKMNLTQAGTTMGTPWYMSPEQIQGEKLDFRSDQYSLGITCYQMFAGQPPFPGKNPVAVAVQHLKEEPIELSTLREDLPRDLCDVIHRMMRKKPEDRFQTSAEIEAALQKLTTASVNIPGRSENWMNSVAQKLPEIRNAILILVVMVFGSFAMGRRWERLDQLPEPVPVSDIQKQETAVRQYALAMLQPDRVAAWEAVTKNFPNSREADLARLRMGIALMSGIVPDRDRAYDVFTSVRTLGEAASNRELQFLGMVGQAYALRDHERNDELEVLTSDIRRITDEIVPQIALEQAPDELRLFYDMTFSDR